MSETTKTLIEWIDLDLRERRQRRELLKELAEYQKTNPPIMMSASRSRPRAVSAPPMPPRPDLRPPATLPENPSLEDVARQLGVSLEDLQRASGSMSLERLMMLLGVSTPTELLEQLRLIIGNQPKGLNRFESMRAACVKARLAGRRVGKMMKIERARAARRESLVKHQAAFKRR